MPQDQRPTASKRGWFLGAAALLLVDALGLVLRSTLAQTSPAPAWTHEYPGKGIIHSVTASKRRDGTEVVVAAGDAVTDSSGEDLRIVAYAADSGRILWEKRLPHRFPVPVDPFNPIPILQPILSRDEDRNILLGSEPNARSKRLPHSLYKLSIEDGSELWCWSAEIPGDRPPSTEGVYVTKATATARGHIWVSGVRAGAAGRAERYIALLEAADGRHRWTIALNATGDLPDVHPLPDTDALVMTPPPSYTHSDSWILKRVDEATGTVKWQREIMQAGGKPLHIVDEANGQVLVFSTPNHSGKGLVPELISFDLGTSVERWRNRAKSVASLPNLRPHGIGLDSSGNAVLFGTSSKVTNFNWLKWHKHPSLPIPMPERKQAWHYRPVSVTISVMDGGVGFQSRLSNHNEELIGLLYESGTQRVRVVFVWQGSSGEELAPWRAIRLDGFDSIPAAGGPEASYGYPRVSTLTPSGRIVTTGDPKGKSEVWRIELW